MTDNTDPFIILISPSLKKADLFSLSFPLPLSFKSILQYQSMSTKQIGGYTVFLSQVLGHGSFGNVYRGIKDDDKQLVAVKIIPKYLIDSNQYLKASLNNQIKIIQSVKSENIVGFCDVMESPKNYYIIQELCDRDLSQVIKPGEHMQESQCVEILTQLCNGFLALVREGIIHRDLKPANIMVRGKTYKIGDFGFSKQFRLNATGEIDQLTMKTTVGTPLYMSLQILKSQEYTSKCDIWALGFIFYEMLHGCTPWRGNRQYQLAQNIERAPFVIQRKDLSPETISFLKGSLQIHEKDRLSWNEVFVHPIFKNKFLGMADENKEYQNQMKSIMTKLRFYFSCNKEHLWEYLNKYGFMNNKEDLTFDKYFEFLRAVNPAITENQAVYIFKKTDIDNSGAISLDQIVEMLKLYGIDLIDNVAFIKVNSHSTPSSDKQIKQLQNSERLDQANPAAAKAAQRLKTFFVKLHKIIVKHNLTLKRVFNDFDPQRKGNLTVNEFKTMLQKMSKEITDQEARLAFKMLDEDDSNSLEFEELNKHYKLVNQLEW